MRGAMPASRRWHCRRLPAGRPDWSPLHINNNNNVFIVIIIISSSSSSSIIIISSSSSSSSSSFILKRTLNALHRGGAQRDVS